MSFWKRRARLTRQCLRRKITASTDILKEEGGNVPNPLHGRSRAAYAIPIAIVIVLSAVMASLARASVAGTLAAGPSTSISFSLDYLVDGLHAPFYVAQQNGCFTQGNLAVSIHPSTGSSDSVSRVASGTAQIGLSDAPTALLGIAKGYPIKVVGVLLLHSAQATETLRSSGITTPQGLENKSIGITPAGAERQEIAALFKINNVDTSKVHLVSISASAGKAILLSGQVDAVNFFPPIFAGDTNKINTIPWFKYGLDTYGTVIIANTAFLQKSPQAVTTFVHCAMLGLRYTFDHPTQAAQVVATAAKGNPTFFQEELAIYRTYWYDPALQTQGLGYMTSAGWNKTQTVSVKYLGQTKALPLSKIYSDSYLGSPVAP